MEPTLLQQATYLIQRRKDIKHLIGKCNIEITKIEEKLKELCTNAKEHDKIIENKEK